MTAYTIAWGWDDTDPSGQHTVVVTTAQQAHAVLDRIAAEAVAEDVPRHLDVYQGSWSPADPTPPYGMQLVWGHPERAAITWLGTRPGYAVDPSLPEWPEPIAHDQDEVASYRTRLTPAAARAAVGEYITTGTRPTCVEWVTE